MTIIRFTPAAPLAPDCFNGPVIDMAAAKGDEPASGMGIRPMVMGSLDSY